LNPFHPESFHDLLGFAPYLDDGLVYFLFRCAEAVQIGFIGLTSRVGISDQVRIVVPFGMKQPGIMIHEQIDDVHVFALKPLGVKIYRRKPVFYIVFDSGKNFISIFTVEDIQSPLQGQVSGK
jgi:hypothetical protein